MGLVGVTVFYEVTGPVRPGSKYCFPVSLTACLSSGASGEKSAENLVKDSGRSVFGETDALCIMCKLSEPYFSLPLLDFHACVPGIPGVTGPK